MRGRGVLRFGARSALLGVVLAVVVSGSALAARIHVDIQAPQHVNAGHKVVLVFVGYTTPKFGWLVVFLDNRACARTGVAESNRAESREFDYAPIHGHFRKTLTIKHSSRGTHYVCAYLVRNGSPYD